VPELDAPTRRLLDIVGATVVDVRIARGWTQRRLARAAGCSQTAIARIERRAVPDLSFRTAGRVLRALGIDVDLRLAPPRIVSRSVRDRAHARCVASVARRLARAGLDVATEVEVGSGRWLGFIDILALHPTRRWLLVLEVKTELLDIGGVDRQLASYVDAAWAAARTLGWRPRAATGILVMLATEETERRLQEHRAYVERAFRVRARTLRSLVSDSAGELPARGLRGLALFDPRSRRRDWLIPTALDGRRTAAPYADRRAYLGSVDRASPRGRSPGA
jgi:transcriptional regulator with XRE-family HTH domain